MVEGDEVDRTGRSRAVEVLSDGSWVVVRMSSWAGRASTGR